jgi:hypothetical protein
MTDPIATIRAELERSPAAPLARAAWQRAIDAGRAGRP